MSTPSLFVFGPQTDWPSAEYLDQLRSKLLSDVRLQDLVSAITELPTLALALADQNPRLKQTPCADNIRRLQEWLEQGTIFVSSTAPNILSMPMTVVIHLVQYINYLDRRKTTHAQVLANSQLGGGIQGFCIGLLSAIAVASSKNENEVVSMGAVALRLAACIGAYIDCGDAMQDDGIGSTSLSLRWKNEVMHQKLLNVLRDYPSAYISVLRDSTDFNVIVSKSDLEAITANLTAAGLIFRPTGLDGRCHSTSNLEFAEELKAFSKTQPGLNFLAQENRLLTPVRSNENGREIIDGPLHHHAIDCILVHVADWKSTIENAVSQLSFISQPPLAVSFGLVDYFPSSITRQFSLRIDRAKDLLPLSTEGTSIDATIDQSVGVLTPSGDSTASAENGSSYSDHAVAVVGMGCRFPEADSTAEFWELLTEGRSTLREMPEQRFKSGQFSRSPNSKLKFFGNFVRDVDAFDHRFFKKSSREAASMDPQQRLLLEVAYQALESSGYFSRPESSRKSPNIGCYIGVCSNDYNDNVATHPPNAFSSLGTLRAFLSGKISHFFGWTGPSVTVDTACSSSAVAIHNACKAIETGECSMALAGGVALYTSPYFYQNLAAASFLSATGSCKPFDAKADGYCRGEGAGLVFLKKLSDALADGDNILGIVAGTAVNQNYNSTYITVPHGESQVELYQKVSNIAGVDTARVSYIEAHGTGTPVGDPIEFESIRRVFGRKEREFKSYVASVKGNIGHLEGASGVAALIKTILMMQHKTIPVQANFQTLNPKIPSLDADNMAIPLATQPWIADEFIACINNYGAAGSNAAMIVRGPPHTVESEDNNLLTLPKYPIWISANSAASLSAYCEALRKWLAAQPQPLRLSDVAFNLARTQNRGLPYALITTVNDLPGLDQVLAAGSNSSSLVNVKLPSAKPVILVFGGQTSTQIGLDKGLYHASTLLRRHLDACDSALHANGLPGLYPAIFQAEPISDIVQLHCMLYSLQYSSAKAWIDSGLHVDAVIGHSFGELTALAVCGSLSFTDGLKLVSGRASLMQHSWGAERGSMLAVETDASTLQILFEQVAEQNKKVQLEIACYNGPTSHVAVGTEASIAALQKLVSDRGIQQKKLNVSHGFHSVFTEPILPALAKLANELNFRPPSIPIETCSKDMSTRLLSAERIVEHTRTSVYFGEAVARIANRLGPCTWIEAGSASSVTNMVRRALAGNASDHTFQGMQLNIAGSNLVDATANLWKAGHNVNFWPFHSSQKPSYRSIISLPPYQFERNRHWLDWSEPAPTVVAAPTQPAVSSTEPAPRQLLSFIGYGGKDRDAEAHFQVDPLSDEYKYYVHGHAVLANPLCPAPLYVELVARAAMTLMGDGKSVDNYVPHVEDLEIKAPLGKGIGQNISLVLKKQDVGYIHPTWLFEMSGNQSVKGDDYSGGPTQLHATGAILLKPQNDRRLVNDFACYDQLVGYNRYERLKDDDATEAMQGQVIYKMFAKVVTYAKHYKGVEKIYALKNEVAGHVTLHSETPEKTITEPLAVDNFVQVSGLHVNSFQDCGDNEVNVCTHVDQILPGPKYRESTARENRSWVVYSSSAPTSEPREILNNIFVFDKATRELVFVVLGARFTRVLISSLSRVLGRANKGESITGPAERQIQPAARTSSTEPRPKSVEAQPQLLGTRKPTVIKPARDIMGEIKTLLNRVAEIPMDQFKDDASLIDIGVDSLMITEVMNELATHFKLDIPADEFANLPDLKALETYLISRGCGGATEISSMSITRGRSNSDSSIGSSMGSQSMTVTVGETAASTPARTPPGSMGKASLPTSSMADVSTDEVVSRLAKIVATHLETESNLTRQTNLVNEGLDSLLWIEVANDIREAFGPSVDATDFTNPDPSFGDLCDFIQSRVSLSSSAPGVEEGYFASSTSQLSSSSSIPIPTPNTASGPATLRDAQKAFEETRWDYDLYTKETGFAKFCLKVYPSQAKLVLAYTVEAMAKLGCSLASLQEGDQVPSVQCLPKHSMELAQLYNILEDGLLIAREDGSNVWVRTKTPVDPNPSAMLLSKILQDFPLHASEHRLLHTTGSKLAECLSGTADPLQLLFRKKEDRELLEEVYTNGPMYAAITKLLASFLGKTYANISAGETVNILELGGGTGGTTKFVVDYLTRNRVPFTYTFTDLSGSLVTAARRKFSSTYSNMEFMTLDIEKAPPQKFHGHFHTIISTNCIHATSNLVLSCANMRAMLRPDGFISLVEFTRNLYWFDIVFGLLEGWWLFKDGRKHVLATETFWEESMRTAGFKHVSWTDGASEEARTLRIITGFNTEAQSPSFVPRQISSTKHDIQTVVYKKEGNLDLLADIYLPQDASPGKRPIALMIHGGGHCLFTRKEVNPKQIRFMLDNGLVPVSVEYRFCPEVNIIDGPMTDVCDALAWARTGLPQVRLNNPAVEVDPSRVVVVGWSTGGHLALTLGYTPLLRGMQPPLAIFSLYPPTNYEAECWQSPIYPDPAVESPDTKYDLLEGVEEHPIADHYPSTNKNYPGMLMSLKDPRWRFILHMNWRAQTLPLLLNGLPSKAALQADPNSPPEEYFYNLPQPPADKVLAMNPYGQIVRGTYKTPTFLLHGTADDLIPWEQSVETVRALQRNGVTADVAILEGVIHLFDTFGGGGPEGDAAIRRGYEFLLRHAF